MLSLFEKILTQNSGVSCMRFMSIISLFVGAAFAFTCIFKGSDLGSATPIISIFIGAAFGGKVAQKFAEKKENVKAS